MRSLVRATVLTCGLVLLFSLSHGFAPAARGQSSEMLVGLSARPSPIAPDPDNARGNAGRRAPGHEQLAARELESARMALSIGNFAEGRRRLEVLVARYPSSGASDQARQELLRLYARPSDSAFPTSAAPIDRPRVAQASEQDFRLNVGDRVFFTDRSAELSTRARQLLEAQARWLKRVQVDVAIEGHADDPGSDESNQELATRRAQAVRDRLVADGVEPKRITLVIYGRDKPVAICSSDDCAAQNRRVVTVLRSTRAAAGQTRPAGAAND